MYKYNFYKYYVILIFFLLNSLIYSQPFIYYPKYLLTDYEGFDLVQIKQLNLADNSESNFYDSTVNTINCKWDNLQEWLIIEFDNSNSVIINIKNKQDIVELPDEANEIGKILNCKSKNNLYVFSAYNDMEYLSKFDLSTYELKPLINFSMNTVLHNYINEEAFLSEDENIIYFSMEDTSTIPYNSSESKICYFSTTQNKIIKERRLSEIGKSAADSYTLYTGRNGQSVINSYFSDQQVSYYRFYDFDKNIGSDFIKFQGNAIPYFTENGKYLILAQTNTKKIDVGSNVIYNTGELFFYDIANQKLIKTITVDPNLKVYNFEEYPNSIFLINDKYDKSIIIDVEKILADIKIKLIFPSYIITGSKDYKIQIIGNNFVNNSKVLWDEKEKSTLFISDTLLQSEILPADISTLGIHKITVINPNDIKSNSVEFKVISKIEAVDSLIKKLNYHCGRFKNKGICNSLMKKLENARKNLVKGNENSAKGILQAFQNELEAQKGKGIPEISYAELNEFCKLILNSFTAR